MRTRTATDGNRPPRRFTLATSCATHRRTAASAPTGRWCSHDTGGACPLDCWVSAVDEASSVTRSTNTPSATMVTASARTATISSKTLTAPPVYPTWSSRRSGRSARTPRRTAYRRRTWYPSSSALPSCSSACASLCSCSAEPVSATSAPSSTLPILD